MKKNENCEGIWEITIGIDKHGRHKLEVKAEATTEGVRDRMWATL